jgi:acyl-CoA synthetase (AMP-forming)/AMP-acid ligase II
VARHRAFDAEATLKSIQADRITFVMLAPTLIQAMLDRTDIDSYDLSSLQLVTYSAAPMPTPVVRRAIQVFGPILMQMYGQTEGSCSALFPHQHRPDGTAREQGWLASAGQPFRDVQIRLIDDQGNECPVGTPGEITYRGTVMFSGYWNKSAASIEALRDGWVHSGDIGRFDEKGFLYIVDRLKDMIISGGENIYSREVEEALLSHPAVSEVAVIGVEDPKWGEAVRAVVVLKPGQQATAEVLIEHCRSRIASYKRPRSLLFASELPKLPSGKISKIELRKTHGAPQA